MDNRNTYGADSKLTQYDGLPNPYEWALEWALNNGVNMVDFDQDVRDRGAEAVLGSILNGRYIGRYRDPDTGKAI